MPHLLYGGVNREVTMVEQLHTFVDEGEVVVPHRAWLTLEAFADTVIPGCKRWPADEAVAGVSDTPGAVQAGALAVLTDPATGLEDGVADMADELDRRAATYAAAIGLPAREKGLAFVRLPYAQRRSLVIELTTEAVDKDYWFLLALFSYMAYDSAPHRPTAEVLAGGFSGLAAMGFAKPGVDGLWRFHPAGYGRPLALSHPLTDERGNLP